MVELTDFPVEVLDIVFSHTHDKKNTTLKNLCLVGNRTFARRLTFKNIIINLHLPLPENHIFYSQFRKIYTSPSLRSKVHSISFTLRGTVDLKFAPLLGTQLPRFENLHTVIMNHVFFDYLHLFGTPLFQTVLPVLHRLPALAHLVIDSGAYLLRSMELPPGYELAKLRRLTLSATSFNAVEFMTYCRPREIEAAGCGRDGVGGNVIAMMFVILKRPEEERCLITRLRLRCGCQTGEYCKQGSFFQNMLVGNTGLTLPCLEELVLVIPFLPELLRPYSFSFCGDQLRRMHIEWCTPSSSQPLNLPSFEMFPLLEELSLLSIQSARQLMPQLRRAPRLAHLICSSESKRNYAETFAWELGAQLEQLEALSHGSHTARIRRGDMGEVAEVLVHEYFQRDWLRFGAYDVM